MIVAVASPRVAARAITGRALLDELELLRNNDIIRGAAPADMDALYREVFNH